VLNPGEQILQIIKKHSGINLPHEIISRNSNLILEGQTESSIYYILSGAVRAVYTTDNEEHSIRFGYEGSIITSLQSLLNNKPSSYSIQAIRKTEFIRIPSKLLFNTIEIDTELNHLYKSLIENLIVQQLEREIDILTTSPEERYNRVLKRSPKLFQQIPAKYIASYLRMTPETLSRIRKS
jgi:CRP/FNR family transcriptional regulator, anaerobic regulatory protein